MNKESLKLAREIIIKYLDKSTINQQDKAELMLNLWILLDENNYEHDTKILKIYGGSKLYRKEKN